MSGFDNCLLQNTPLAKQMVQVPLFEFPSAASMQSSSREVCTALTFGLTTGWEEVDGEDKQILPLLLHSCSIQWTQQPLTDSSLKSSSIIAFCLSKDLLGALQKQKAGLVLCAPAPKPYRENTSRKGTWLFPLSCAWEKAALP